MRFAARRASRICQPSSIPRSCRPATFASRRSTERMPTRQTDSPSNLVCWRGRFGGRWLTGWRGEGYERIRQSDERHIAPGAETIRELFGGQPTLILLDEVSVYLRKVERTFPEASKQFAAFVHDLFEAVASTPQVALVYTLAIGKDDQAKDAYKEENERAAAAMAEAESVAVRSTTPLNPTEEDETPNVLRARLFETVDLVAAKTLADAY